MEAATETARLTFAVALVSSRSMRGLFVVVSACLAGVACARYAPPRPHEVEANTDAPSAYRVVLQVLGQDSYRIVEERRTERTVRVRSHIDENDERRPSFITAFVAQNGTVHFEPSGFLVKPDGSVHSKLNHEVTRLEQQVAQQLGAPMPAGAPPAGQMRTAALPNTAGSPGASGLPRAWTEPAYDPKTWGHGDFTCVPVKLPSDTRQLRLRLSNGEDADVSLSIAYSPGLCRSPGQCPLSDGCPALGLGDAQQVERLAERLAKGQFDRQATVVLDGRPMAIVDLSKHGSISQTLNPGSR
jgi:hypothetical protein